MNQINQVLNQSTESMTIAELRQVRVGLTIQVKKYWDTHTLLIKSHLFTMVK